MGTFNQNNQIVHGDQYNVSGNASINFGVIKQKSEVADELTKLLNVLDSLIQKGIISTEIASNAKVELQSAIAETQKSEPVSNKIIDKINNAKALIEGIASAGGLVKILVEAADIVRKFF